MNLIETGGWRHFLGDGSGCLPVKADEEVGGEVKGVFICFMNDGRHLLIGLLCRSSPQIENSQISPPMKRPTRFDRA